MTRKDLLVIALLAFGVALPATANQAYFENYRKQLAQEIEMLDWNLRHSSVAPSLAPRTQQDSLDKIERAKEALGSGNTRLAEDLAAEAALPLTTVARKDDLGSHPDQLRYFREIRQALLSITDSAERISDEQGAARDYRSDTLVALAQAEYELKAGNVEAAFAIIGDRYDAVSQSAADYRRGQTFTIAATEWRDGKQFQDGVRRIDERRALTEYLILEAQAEGIDQTPLREALAIAKASLAQATGYAQQEHWDKAYASLELAFAEIEDRWRMVGLEW
ncbi:MAG TPA: hypothetical protein VIS73_14180 [Rhodocyclaceae bacterium]